MFHGIANNSTDFGFSRDVHIIYYPAYGRFFSYPPLPSALPPIRGPLRMKHKLNNPLPEETLSARPARRAHSESDYADIREKPDEF